MKFAAIASSKPRSWPVDFALALKLQNPPFRVYKPNPRLKFSLPISPEVLIKWHSYPSLKWASLNGLAQKYMARLTVVNGFGIVAQIVISDLFIK